MTNTPYYILIVFYIAFVGSVVLANAIAFLSVKLVQYIWTRRSVSRTNAEDMLAAQTSTAHGS